MEQHVSEQYPESNAPAEESLEDTYGQPNDGPDVLDEPRLDAEVTDETTDADMGLDDTETVPVEAEEEAVADEPAEELDPLEAFRRELLMKPDCSEETIFLTRAQAEKKLELASLLDRPT